MLFDGKIIVTIGYSGTVVAFHNDNTITRKFFFEKFDEKQLDNVASYFKAKKHFKIYILLDSIDQNYKKTSYPSVRRMDLKNLTRRDLGGISTKDTIKDSQIHNLIKEKTKNGKITKKWDVLLVTASISDEITQWIEFLTTMPNQIEGIYTIPIETFNIAKKLSLKIKKNNELKRKKKQKKSKNNNEDPKKNTNNIYCLVIYTKVNGFRQVIFSDYGTVFTRIINYDINSDEFIKNYEQDIYSTFEYLKRSYSDINIDDIEVINILPDKLIKKIDNLSTKELAIVNYTPANAAKNLKFKKNIIPQDSEFCDLLISRSFFHFKKLLRFRTPKIAASFKMFTAMKSSYYFNLFLSIFFFIELLSNVNIRVDFDKEITKAEVKMFKATEELHSVQNKVLNIKNEDGKSVNIEKSVEIGKINEVIGGISNNVFDRFDDLSFIKNFDVTLSRIYFDIQNYSPQTPSAKSNYAGRFSGKIGNESGNIDDLFQEFDNLTVEANAATKNSYVKFSKLPRDIDFNQKYYEFPITFSITPK